MSSEGLKSRCVGCGVELPRIDGPTHAYMTSLPACFELFNTLLACEYSDYRLAATHRLTVDTYAVQHPGSDKTRQQIQSVGLHLARLSVQLDSPMPPKETNNVMLGFAKAKSTLIHLEPPASFSLTVGDVAPFAGQPAHSERVRAWAAATWQDWAEHHSYIKSWVDEHMQR